MENKDLLVSIPLTLYNELLETKFNYKTTTKYCWKKGIA